MKILCETTGNFMLADLANGQVVEAYRPSVVVMTSFIEQRALLGQLRKLADLTDEATDEEFARYVKDSENMVLAVEAFTAAFGVEKTTEKRGKRGKRKSNEPEEAFETPEE